MKTIIECFFTPFVSPLLWATYLLCYIVWQAANERFFDAISILSIIVVVLFTIATHVFLSLWSFDAFKSRREYLEEIKDRERVNI
jgi:hypothetical protein